MAVELCPGLHGPVVGLEGDARVGVVVKRGLLVIPDDGEPLVVGPFKGGDREHEIRRRIEDALDGMEGTVISVRIHAATDAAPGAVVHWLRGDTAWQRGET